LIGYYLPDIQLSQRGRIEKISIKVAGSIYRACEQARICPEKILFFRKIDDMSGNILVCPEKIGEFPPPPPPSRSPTIFEKNINLEPSFNAPGPHQTLVTRCPF
jgi:hypothetical protein